MRLVQEDGPACFSHTTMEVKSEELGVQRDRLKGKKA